jgi:uncharacterized protein
MITLRDWPSDLAALHGGTNVRETNERLRERDDMSGDELIYEAMQGNLVGIRQLLANGGDVNFANQCGVTALMMACQWNRTEVVRFLLDKGADVHPRDAQSGFNALMYSCLSGNSHLVRLVLAEQPMVDATDAAGRTALMMAAILGRSEVVRLLVQGGASLDLTDARGASASDWARETGHLEVVDYLRMGIRDDLAETNLY